MNRRNLKLSSTQLQYAFAILRALVSIPTRYALMPFTLRKEAQKALRESEDRLRMQTQELETIIGIVSHDLRSPLVNVKGFSNEIAKDSQALRSLLSGIQIDPRARKQIETILNESLPESLQFIQASADAMNNLVVSLTEVVRAGLAISKPERLNVNNIIAQALASIKIHFKNTNVDYDIDSVPQCFADPTQVSQIFTNLLDNAVKYLDPVRQGHVCVGGEIENGQAVYWVADNGIGIPPDEEEKIFEPYCQLKEKLAGGVGMGLVTVKRMIERNNGRIWVVSERGKGTSFYVALPA